MSLINQMLQDLEQRNAAARMDPLAGEVRTAVALPARSYRLYVLFLLGLVCVAVLAWWFFTRPSAPVPITPRPATALPANPQVVAPASPAPQAPLETGGGWDPKTAESVSATPAAEVASPVEMPAVTAPPSPVSPIPQAKPAASPGEPVAPPDSRAPVGLPTEKPMLKPQGKAGGPETLKTVSPTQQADNFYRQAGIWVQQGRVAEAEDVLRKSLEQNPRHLKARQMLAGLLIENHQHSEAAQLLHDGLQLAPESGLSMALARLQVESGDQSAALETLESGMKSADDDAEYHAFYAALLARLGRHEEAVQHYLVALRSDPAMPTWLVGIGISLQASGKNNDAIAAFRRARETGQLTPQLADFVDQRLREIKPVAP